MNILIAGGGKTVYFLCRTFISKGHKITVINRDHDESVWLARQLKIVSIHGDWSDPLVLEEAETNSMDAVLAVTPNDHDNLAICQIASLHFKVPQTLALVNDPDHEEVFRQLGITAVSTARILSNLIEQRVGFGEITNLITASEGKLNITEIELMETSPVARKQIRDIAFPQNSLLAYILHEGQPTIPKGDTVLYPGDRVFVITLPENYAETIRMLTGDRR
jgi:trk system potassium uptake protein TrkA